MTMYLADDMTEFELTDTAAEQREVSRPAVTTDDEFKLAQAVAAGIDREAAWEALHEYDRR